VAFNNSPTLLSLILPRAESCLDEEKRKFSKCSPIIVGVINEQSSLLEEGLEEDKSALVISRKRSMSSILKKFISLKI
jgi:hypothetical protein